ncbi:hypothetical protein ACROYT_G017791 [Oculina patagonica]
MWDTRRDKKEEFLLKVSVQCQAICKADQFTIVTSNDSFLRCLNCATCHPGRGLNPTCGSRITHPPHIECEDCPSGTFSDKYDSAPCHSCQHCAEHEKLTATCTSTSDRICNGTCEKGYFFANPHNNCEQCSYCCFDGRDQEQPECIKQGLNATGRHCSGRLDKQCGPPPTTVVTTKRTTVTHLPPTTHQIPSTNTTTPALANVISSPTHPPTKHHYYTATIVLSVLGGLLLAALVVGAIIHQRKSQIWRRKRTNGTGNPPSIQIDAGDRSPTQRNHDNYASQGPQSVVYISEHPRVQALQNTGYAPSTPSATPEVSPSATPQQTDDEVEELPDVISVRNKRLLKRQSSRDAQSSAPKKEGANESLLDPKEQADDDENVKGQERRGSGHGNSRKRSLEAIKRKFSLSSSLEKDDYQPLSEEDPDEPPGNGEVGSKMRSGPTSSFKAALKRKFSSSEKEQDYQQVRREDPDEGQCDNFFTTCTEPVKIEVEPMRQEQKEGSKVEFKCNVQGKNKVFYQWIKDGTPMPGQNDSTLAFSCVDLRDFGCFVCQVSLADSQCGCFKSSAAELDVVPRDGMAYRCLRDVDPNTQGKIETLLTKKIHGLGGWRQVAYKYAMDNDDIDSLEGSQEAGKTIISYLKATNPDLKVYEFCKTLKDHNIRRFDIIKELLGHLSVPVTERTT